MELDKVKLETTWNDAAGSINNNFTKIAEAIESGGGSGSGGIANVEIETDAPSYLEVSANPTQEGVKLQINPIIPTSINSETSGFASVKAVKNALIAEPSEHNFTWRVATGDSKLTDSLAVVNKLLGRTIIWRQMIGSLTSTTTRGLNISYSSGVITMALQNVATKLSPMSASFGSLGARLTDGHIYLLTSTRPYKGVGIREGSSGTFRQANRVFTAEVNSTAYFAISSDFIFDSEFLWSAANSKYSTSAITMKFNLFDLTEMFGSGAEPRNIGEFRKLYPKKYYEYSETSHRIGVRPLFIDNPVYNLWDSADAEDGIVYYLTGYWRATSYHAGWKTCIIPVIPNTEYYLKDVANRTAVMPCVFYGEDMTQLRDANGNVAEGISYAGAQSLNASAANLSGIIKTPENAAYMAVMVNSKYASSACVSVSSRRNGDAEAYTPIGLSLNVVNTITDTDGKQVFPYGLLSFEDVADEIGEGYALKYVDYDVVDGEISNLRKNKILNASGVEEIRPAYYPINTRLWMTWRVRRGATEKVTLSDVSAPFRASISYALDANDLLPSPLEDKRDVFMKILAVDENGNTYKSANYAKDSGDIDYGSEGYIPDCSMVKAYVENYVSEHYPTTVATAPEREFREGDTNTVAKHEQFPNVVYEYPNLLGAMYLSISLLNPSDNFAQTWTLRLFPNRGDKELQIKFFSPNDSSIAIKWVNGTSPTWENSDIMQNVLEIVIRQFSEETYIGEWKIYR